MRHYSQFSKVILLENNSTDKTVDIGKALGAEIRSFNVKDEIDDSWYTYIKNNCWKESDADWVIIVDADEFVYSPWLPDILSKTKHTIFAPDYYDMYSDLPPSGSGQIYDEVFMGRRDKTKMNLFQPREIVEINYDPGCHVAKPTGNVSIAMSTDIRTLHMRYLSIDYVLDRNRMGAQRLSALNRKMGWGYHFDFPPEKVIADFNEAKRDLIDIRL
jgi:glycosyltransferase involved in cell wall biosynthesis